MGKTLFQKIWDAHSVGILPDGRTQMFIATHFLHEVTSPQAFGMVRDLGLAVRHPERTFATVDHIIPTDNQAEPFADATADAMIRELRRNCAENGIRFFDLPTGLQGIVHMVGPELGITQPGMTIVCGDSHTATHGAFGSIAMGIGTTQVRDVLATQTLALSPLKVRRINVNGKLAPGVRAKDVALHIIGLLGAKGGLGFAYEYGGDVIDAMSMDERMTLCNMSIEGAARCGYVNPDMTTVEYIKGRLFAPEGADWDKAVERWLSFASDADADYTRVAVIGKPNVGKSSLVNLILGEKRVIVSNVAGTTRDSVDTRFENKYGKYIFVDTAGIRRKSRVDDRIEKFSVMRAKLAIERADVCLIMIDARDGVTEQDTNCLLYTSPSPRDRG